MLRKITRQYMGYIALLEAMRFDLAAEYLVMAAMLAEIKSRALLPNLWALRLMKQKIQGRS